MKINVLLASSGPPRLKGPVSDFRLRESIQGLRGPSENIVAKTITFRILEGRGKLDKEALSWLILPPYAEF